MKIFTGRNRNSLAASDRIATIIAGLILKAQAGLAEACAKSFNAYSSRKKKTIFLTVAGLVVGMLLCGVIFKGYTIPALKQNYKPATHIGMASDVNTSGKMDAQLTDSLTKRH